MKFTLEPVSNAKQGNRMFVRAGAGKVWSLLAPENIYCREFAITHVHHDKPAQWKRIAGGWKLCQTLADQGIRYEGAFRPRTDGSMEMEYTFTNDSRKPMTELQADFCFSAGGGLWTYADDIDSMMRANTAFTGPLKERNFDWTRRTVVPTQAGLTVVGDINTYFPVPVNRACIGGKNVADFPIIFCMSVDYKETYAAGWECCTSLYCAMGYCIHTMAYIGTIPPGGSVTRHGRFYYMKSHAYTVLAKFQRDLKIV
jgi:hypothetical protein